MIKRLLIALLLASPLFASAATFDPCEQLAKQYKYAAQNRDKGVPLAKSISDLIYPDTATREQIALVKAMAWIYEDRQYSPVFFEEFARNACNAS